MLGRLEDCLLNSFWPAFALTDLQRARLSCFVAGVICIFCLRQYLGITHDSQLYALIAQAGALPENFAHELFLSGQSQHRYTLFSRVVQPITDILGVDVGLMLLTAVGLLTWLFALLRLVERVHQTARLPAIVFCLTGYDTFGVFQYAEQDYLEKK
jgi:hypothetical protein